MKIPYLSEAQKRFMRLHQQYIVDKWQQLFQGATIRASCNIMHATLNLAELEQLFSFGLMQPYPNTYGVQLTDLGKDWTEC